MRIRFFSTGGTIDKIYFDANSTFEVGESYLKEILFRANVTFDYSIEEILRKDSLDLTDVDREVILNRVEACHEDRVVITHGTDTMALTGDLLKEVHSKTILMTGSMQPARFRETDATFNIGAAVGAVQCLPYGVYITMNGKIFDPSEVKKNFAEKRFEKVREQNSSSTSESFAFNDDLDEYN